MSLAVRRMISQACARREASFQRMLANPSGLTTEKNACSNISTRFATPSANAPPLLPSPVTTAQMGTRRRLIRARFCAMASPCPRASAPMPGYAPGVSMKVTTGLPNFSAWRISLSALR